MRKAVVGLAVGESVGVDVVGDMEGNKVGLVEGEYVWPVRVGDREG